MRKQDNSYSLMNKTQADYKLGFKKKGDIQKKTIEEKLYFS